MHQFDHFVARVSIAYRAADGNGARHEEDIGIDPRSGRGRTGDFGRYCGACIAVRALRVGAENMIDRVVEPVVCCRKDLSERMIEREMLHPTVCIVCMTPKQ